MPGLKRLCRVLTSALLVVAVVASNGGVARAQVGATSEPVSREVFRDHISAAIVQTRCIYCHVEGGRSGHTRLVFVRESDTPDHESLNLQAFADFLATVEGGQERILTKIQGVAHGGGAQVPAGSANFANVDHFLALLAGHPQGFIARFLERLDAGEPSLLFGVTTPADGDTVAGDAVAISATGAPTAAVHFAYRLADAPEEGFAYLGAAANGAAARLAWNTSVLMDGDYEIAALFTQDEGDNVTSDAIVVSVDNVEPAGPPDIEEDRGHKTQALRMDAAHEVITADGVVVMIPAGALDGDDRIMITVTDPPDPETAPGDAVGTGIDIALSSGQDVFREAVTVSLPYPEGKPDGLVDHTSIPETGLSLWFFDPQADAWVLIPASRVQPDANLVVADGTQTGEFGIFNAPLLRVEQDGGAMTGLAFGAGATALTFTVVNDNPASQPLTWTIDPPAPAWLSVAPDRGAGDSGSGARVAVSVDRTGLEPGDYAGTLHIRSNGGVREVSVSMRVPAGPSGGGCAVLSGLSGAPPDPTLIGLLGLVTLYLIFGRRRLRRQAAMG